MPILNENLRQRIEPAVYRFKIIPQAKARQRQVIKRIQDQGHASVVFIVSSLPMWRFQAIYDLLQKDARFSPHIALYPFTTFSDAQREESISSLRTYFQGKGIPYEDLSQESSPGQVLKDRLSPDIVFYPQPYNYLYFNDLDSPFFNDSLNCYIPYAIWTPAGFNRSYLKETAWRLFYPAQMHYLEAKKHQYNHGANVRITGDPIIDFFQASGSKQVWKKQDKPKKKIIWAPHFSFIDNGIMYRDSFTWLSECMQEVAVQYKDSVQFAFKPHPRLKSEVDSHPQRGKERADQYYQFWRDGENTQLETGPYIDLFKESDAMIHDCGSFSVEYLLLGKPVMFMTQDLKKSLARQNELGQQALLSHYPGHSKEDIEAFINNTVMNGDDPMQEVRKSFYDKYLRPPGERSVAENIYHEILIGLGFER